ncbi:type II toxin-antitoxin system RelE/ParE family toxin [Xenorhabdus lircayensis]|uniref:Type II toxin-antitoxin system RelE/ParE family toxin n=1 Tax=Xenorhabdus lircayensis TaxID=2763499 RepID=A0ABS0U982_9GAMM|nr:type II toxin-antitoxin system RelE/ParE family toxin [Xenorhabdus lircayensis]MBI6550441.1 type II toxin-antitoxin system RelE/ParE family toxin [Xenorhabdus lircayensis]
MAVEFKERWLERFYEDDVPHKCIPSALSGVLYRKLQMLDAATEYNDLKAPTGNGFEHLKGNLQEYCSIRVNRKYRLIFQWVDKTAVDTYLDPHKY